MSLRINTNVSALNAYQNLQNNQNAQADAIEKLSSGLRINKAADDAAGLSISEGLTSQINGLTQAVSNAQDGINVAQIADGALGTASTILQRMRTLVVQAGNAGTQDNSSLTAIQSEVKALNTQLDNIANQTKFGSTNLLDGSYNSNFQVGANGGDTIKLDLSKANVKSTSLSDTTVGGSGLNLSTLNITQYGTAGYKPVDATGKDSTTVGSATLGDGYTAAVPGPPPVPASPGKYGTAESTADLQTIDSALSTVSAARSGIGATQNQLNYTVSNLQTSITNVTASRSNLTDADLAVEVSKMTQAQILSQAATSVLAQANSAPQAVLKLLG